MRHFWKTTLVAAATMGAAAALPDVAQAGVSVGVSIGGPAPAYYYGPGYYPPGPCDAYDYYYAGDCGYATYTGPVFINGAWVTGPHYYRWWGGRPVFWYRGGWHSWAGWRGARWNWNHGPGWGWRGGHWNRAWGSAHWRGPGWRGNVRMRENVHVRENFGGVRVHENIRAHDRRR